MNVAPYIQFFPTLRCNSSCHFCFNRGLRALEDIKVTDFQQMVFTLKEVGVTCIDMLGGEPTLHPELMGLLDIIREQRLTCNLSSNGSNVGILHSLSATYEKEFLRIGISLNDAAVSPDLHDYIVRHRPALKSVLTKTATMPESSKQYRGLPEIDYYVLYLDVVERQGLEDSLPFEHYYAALRRLQQMYQGLKGVYCAGFIPHQADDSFVKSPRCPAGTTKLSMLADGSVYPCYLFFPYPEFSLGNIFRDDYQKIWQNPLLDFFRSFTKNRCPNTGCSLFSACHGGCPAMSYRFYHHLAAPDPRCMREKLATDYATP